jgi:hypothetical protein
MMNIVPSKLSLENTNQMSLKLWMVYIYQRATKLEII